MQIRNSRLGGAMPLTLASIAATLALATVPVPAAAQAAAPPVKAPAAQAKPDTTALPSARTIIDRHVEAIGGRKAVLAHTSSHATGTMSIPSAGMTGTLDVYSAKPDKTVVRITLGGIGEIAEGFDGTTAWSIQPMTGPALAQGKELEEKKFDADFYSELHDPARYTSMKTVEKTTFEGRPAYKISLVRKNGGEDFEFYDVETGLKAGTTATRDMPMGSVTVTQIQADYKKFGDMLLPTTLKQTAMGATQVLTFTSVEFDTVSPAVFELPAAIKALVK